MLKKTDRKSAAGLLGRPLIFGTLAGTLCVLLLLLLAAALCVAADVPAGLIAPMAFVACAAGAALGGAVCAKITKKNGWLYGMLCGLFVYLLLTLVGFICVRVATPSHLLVNLLICLACGAVGGIIGVNAGRGGYKL